MTSAQGAPGLLSPLTVGSLSLPNRVVMGSMHTGLEDDADAERLIAFYQARVHGGVGLIITGGIAPNHAGRMSDGETPLDAPRVVDFHRAITSAVHASGGLIAAQILHSGRYGAHDAAVGPSAHVSPLTRRVPHVLSNLEVHHTVDAFAAAVATCESAGYDAVEIMGSEGYLITQFLAPRTNDRHDEWGGDPARRRRFAVEVVRRARERVAPDFPIIFRLSLADLVADGQTWSEILDLAAELEDTGVSVFNSGIGWHEARVPTVQSLVPRGAWIDYTRALRDAVGVPVCASNRVNSPELAEQIVADGSADLVSMARPLLADPQFVAKVATGHRHLINTCIGCNQACLDNAFVGAPVSCVVNPTAGRETVMQIRPAATAKRVAVVGGGPAGLSAAVTAAERGHRVTLFERNPALGGQFRLAMSVPGKEDFADSLSYFEEKLRHLDVDVRLGVQADSTAVIPFEEVVIATGVEPRIPELVGVDLPGVTTYADVLSGRSPVGDRVAVIGAGGIGVDVCTWLTRNQESLDDWMSRWAISPRSDRPGDLSTPHADRGTARTASRRTVTLLQRKSSPIGAGLAKTTGWVHRLELDQAGVHLVNGAHYESITSRTDGLVLAYRTGARSHNLTVDTIILCTGQNSVRNIPDAPRRRFRVIGGAHVASELDAERAIKDGFEVAARL